MTCSRKVISAKLQLIISTSQCDTFLIIMTETDRRTQL